MVTTLQKRVFKTYGQDTSGSRGLLDASRPHNSRDPSSIILVSGVDDYEIVVNSVTITTVSPSTNPLGATGSLPFIFTISYEGATTDRIQGSVNQNRPYRSKSGFSVPSGKDLLLYIVDFRIVDGVMSNVAVDYTLKRTGVATETPASTWTPETPGNLELWMDAASAVRYNSSYVVSSWTDQSTNDYVSTGAPGGTLTVVNSAANNLPTIGFDGGDGMGGGDFLTLPNSSVIFIPAPMSVFVVVDPGRAGSRDKLFAVGTNGDEFSFNVTDSKAAVYGDALGDNQDTTADSVIPSGFNVIGITISEDEGMGSTMQYYLNGAADGSYNVGWVMGITGNFRGIGGDGSSYFFLGDIAEMVVYDSILASGDLDALHTYFNDKYDI